MPDNLIASCGINFASCDIFLATLANDNNLRLEIIEKYKNLYKETDINPEMINCTGCTEKGVKYFRCSQCKIRDCAVSKKLKHVLNVMICDYVHY